MLDLNEALKASLAKEKPSKKEKAGRVQAHGFVKLLAGTSGYASKEWKGAFYRRS